jgi:hypothetical protein
MPWKETTQVQARVRFVEDWLAKEYESLAVLCRVHGVSRKTGYKWVGRFLLTPDLRVRASARRHGPVDQLDAPDEADVAGEIDGAAARSVAEGMPQAR